MLKKNHGKKLLFFKLILKISFKHFALQDVLQDSE